MKSQSLWILIGVVIVVLIAIRRQRKSRGGLLPGYEPFEEDFEEDFEDGYNCSQEWATCPNGPPYCYWGDKEWNKGKCCQKPWSSLEGCQDPVTAAPTLAAASPEGFAPY